MVVVVVVIVAAAGRILQLALHCTEERWKVQVHTILYHNDNNKTAQSWIVQVQMEGEVNWKVVSPGAYMEENAKG